MNTLRETLQGYAESGSYCRIDRDSFDTKHCGYVVALGDDHVALEVFDNLYREGVHLFRLDDISEVFQTDVDVFFDKMICGEGLREEVPPKHALLGFRELLSWVRAERKLVVAEEEETIESDERKFWLGRVIKLGEELIRFHYVDASGCWDSGPTEFKLADITRMEVGSQYCELFAKYAPYVDPNEESIP